MESHMLTKKKKMRFTTTAEQKELIGEDRLSGLPDELIHNILSFTDAKLAVQTSALSKRWKPVWTTLPYLNFFSPFCDDKETNKFIRECKFIHSFLSQRNNESEISTLHLSFGIEDKFIISPRLFHKIVHYAISHNVKDLDIQGLEFNVAELSTITSTSLKKLKLHLSSVELLKSHCWDLPALTTLQLKGPCPFRKMSFPRTYLMCLPSLRTLSLDSFDLPIPISLPALTTLFLKRCQLPSKCDFPALSTVTLDDVVFPVIKSRFFIHLVKLRSLTVVFRKKIVANCHICCPQLVNMKIISHLNTITTHSGQIIVLGPKILNFTAVGFLPFTSGASFLSNVNIRLRGSIPIASSEKLKKYYRQVTHLFQGVGSARILTLDIETVEALSAVSNYFARFSSPFYNLKYVKLPEGYAESSMPPHLKSYLLGGSPNGTIVTTLPQDKLVPQKLPVCPTSQKLLPENPSATVGARAGNELESSSREAIGFGLWKGHEVNSEFLGLLDCIVKRYPETFDYFTTSSKKLGTIKLNMLCTTVKAFSKTSLAEIDTETISEYRALFADLQRSFNVKWLVERLNYIEQLQFSQPLLDKIHAVDSRIDDTKSKLQDLQDLRTRMTTEARTEVGTMGSNLVGYIGDDLFSGP